MKDFDLYGWDRKHPHPGDRSSWIRKRAAAQDPPWVELSDDKKLLMDVSAKDIAQQVGLERAAAVLGVSKEVIDAWQNGTLWSYSEPPPWEQEYSLSVQTWEVRRATAILEWYAVQMKVQASLEACLPPLLEFSRKELTDSEGEDMIDDALCIAAIAIIQTYVRTRDGMEVHNAR